MTHSPLNAKTIRSVLKAIREFRADFEEVTIAGVTVKFAERAQEAAKKKPEPAKDRAGSISAIRSLSMTPPVFEGRLEGEKA